MAAWRRKLIDLFPDDRIEWEQEDSVYAAFSELLVQLDAAAQQNDVHTMSRIFEFAEWCHSQKSTDLWNAAGVSFFEHLGDEPAVASIVGQYLKRDIFEEIKGLIHEMRGADAVEAVRRSYDA